MMIELCGQCLQPMAGEPEAREANGLSVHARCAGRQLDMFGGVLPARERVLSFSWYSADGVEHLENGVSLRGGQLCR